MIDESFREPAYCCVCRVCVCVRARVRACVCVWLLIVSLPTLLRGLTGSQQDRLKRSLTQSELPQRMCSPYRTVSHSQSALLLVENICGIRTSLLSSHPKSNRLNFITEAKRGKLSSNVSTSLAPCQALDQVFVGATKSYRAFLFA